ncbi:MAG: polyphosphate kinase 2 family protein [Fluviicola sp.]|nr:polyphosphate kinase 2 family protein [Fluviicola sp.]
MNQYLSNLKIESSGEIISFRKYPTDYTLTTHTKEECEDLLKENLENLSCLQDKFYANKRYSLLIVLQGMDAAGKDGIISHVMRGMNPEGIKVSGFKTPSSTELSHDYFWRHYKELPARGEIGIFNRSHYENVLITKVHPEMILNENIPYVQDLGDINDRFWKKRYRQIRKFEQNLIENGTIILKFYLHLSKQEQKKRFLERIENPDKNWKFSMADISERGYWSDYQCAYEHAVSETSTKKAPWFIIPADNKWFARFAVGTIITRHIEDLKLEYPVLSKEQVTELEQMKSYLQAEK